MATKRQGKIKLTVWWQGGYHDNQGRYYSELEAQKMFREKTAVQTEWKARKTPTPKPGPGRKEGVKSLKKVDGGYQNQHGVIFTAEQKKALERSVARSNYFREKQIKAEDAMVAPSGRDNAQMRTMGKESDFIISRQGGSLQGFKSIAEYNKFMKKQERIQSGDYLDDKTRLYKHNHMQALKNVFGSEADDVIKKIKYMRLDKYREMLQKDEFLEVNYVYDPSKLSGKLNQIRISLGMEADEEDYEE